MSKKNPNQLAPVDQKEFKRLLCKFLFCFVSNLEVYTGKKIKGEKKKKEKRGNKVFLLWKLFPVYIKIYLERTCIWLC